MLERLKEIREENEIYQDTLAELLNVSQEAYSNYEIGKRMIPYTALGILADYYETSVDYLMGRTDVKKPYPPTTRKKI